MLGLTLEGGASRTLFSCGVMDVLIEEGIIADYVVGVSAGISFGVSYASMQKGRNLELARKYMPDKRYSGFRHLINPKNKSIYNLDFVFHQIPENLLPFDYEAFKNFPGKVIGVLTNVETGLPEYVKIPYNDRYCTVLRASCALPILFPIIKIGENKYMDGGISDSIPFKHTINCGCDKNIVILTRPEGYLKKNDYFTLYAARKYRKYEKFSESILRRADMYNKQLSDLEQLEKDGKVFVFRPSYAGTVRRTESDPRILEALYYNGVSEAKNRIEELKKYLYNKGE